MVKTPYQFRYYGEGNPKNEPKTLSKDELIGRKNDIFSTYGKKFITQIGIQGIPGTRFKLNNGANWIEIGKTGIYELDLEEKGFIDNITFEDNLAIEKKNNPEIKNFFLFIDILCEDPNTTISQEDFYNKNSDYYLIIAGGNAGNLQINKGVNE